MITRKDRIEQIDDDLYDLVLGNDSEDDLDKFLDELPQNEETVEALVHFIKTGIDGCYEIYETLFSDKFIEILKDKGDFECICQIAREVFDCDFEDIK